MKKLIYSIFIIMFIPYLVVNMFFKEKEINLEVKLKMNDQINNVPLEEYIIGVLASEMPASFEMEALKAGAVAARTYVLYKMNKHNSYDVDNTVLNQVYSDNNELKNKWKDNYDIYYEKIKKAVMDTKGEYIDYNGQIIEALYFSTSSGYTENSEDVFNKYLPYLRSVESGWDKLSPVFSEKNIYSLEEFYKILDITFSNKLDIEIIDSTKTNFIKKIKINNIEFSNKDITKLFNLKSSNFKIYKIDNSVIIETKGYGHGVGMSQYGAQGMAIEGYKYDEILNYYYQGTRIRKIIE